MKILILNGPNLNLLGFREPEVYGEKSFDTFLEELTLYYPSHQIDYFQSNHEGELIDKLQQADSLFDAIVFNPGAYAHTSVALADGLKSVRIPVIEVHISNVFARESFRHVSLTAVHCAGCVSGFGLNSYRIAIESVINQLIKN
jgi:3-dehydroquinate dehydratase II